MICDYVIIRATTCDITKPHFDIFQHDPPPQLSIPTDSAFRIHTNTTKKQIKHCEFIQTRQRTSFYKLTVHLSSHCYPLLTDLEPCVMKNRKKKKTKKKKKTPKKNPKKIKKKKSKKIPPRTQKKKKKIKKKK